MRWKEFIPRVHWRMFLTLVVPIAHSLLSLTPREMAGRHPLPPSDSRGPFIPDYSSLLLFIPNPLTSLSEFGSFPLPPISFLPLTPTFHPAPLLASELLLPPSPTLNLHSSFFLLSTPVFYSPWRLLISSVPLLQRPVNYILSEIRCDFNFKGKAGFCSF